MVAVQQDLHKPSEELALSMPLCAISGKQNTHPHDKTELQAITFLVDIYTG